MGANQTLTDTIFIDISTDRDMSSNPLNCDCRASWLAEWVLQHEELVPPTCHLPAALRNTPIVKVQTHLLTCPGEQLSDCCVICSGS